MMKFLQTVNLIVAVAFFLCYAYQFLYIPVPLLLKGRKLREGKDNSFAVLICARNEALVLPQLIESIRRQSYSKGKIDVFVIADNCTDGTAAAARAAGATVYERFNSRQVGKGYALHQLLKHIGEDYPEGFDGYFVFDADNILEPDFIERMNETFSSGYEIVTGYRNSKNYGDNWISAGYGLWFLRESRFLNEARYLLGTSCSVSGTGFLFSRKVLEDAGGWPFNLLTEDIEFSVNRIINGYRIGFCRRAEFYDEQPVTFSQSCRQRMRWAKGYLQVFGRYGGELASGALKGRFACFDMMMAIMPAIVLSAISVFATAALFADELISGAGFLAAAEPALRMIGGSYLTLLFIGGLTTVSEWRHIQTGTAKKIFYIFTFPLFMFTYIPISLCAVFARVEWKPIEHSVVVSADMLQRQADAAKIQSKAS